MKWFTFFIFFPLLGFAVEKTTLVAEKQDLNQLLKEVTASYRQAKVVSMSVDKSIDQGWKAPTLSSGKLYYYRGKIRWEIETPEKNWTIFDGKNWWNVEFASPDFPGKNKVTHSAIAKKNKAQFFLLDLLESEKLSQQFEIVMEKENGFEKELKLTAKGASTELKDIHLTVNVKKNFIEQVSFKDDVDNLTTIKLGQPHAVKNTEVDFFKYKANLKQDQVVEI